MLHGALTASLPSERACFAVRSESLSYHAITRAIPESAPALRGVSLPKDILNDTRRDDDAALQNLYVKEYVNILCAADNPSVAGRAGAFMSLTMSGGTSKRVAVEYELIARRLRALVLDNLVRDKWGAAGLRIVNILRDCGKLDGEQVCGPTCFCTRLFLILSPDCEEGNVSKGGSPEVLEGHEHRGYSFVSGALTDSRSRAQSLHLPLVRISIMLCWNFV